VKTETKKIMAAIGEAALLEQLAEESAELAQAALKMARKLRGENPTPVTHAEAMEHLREEIGDVRLCLRILDDDIGGMDTSAIEEQKLHRWLDRLENFSKGATLPCNMTAK